MPPGTSAMTLPISSVSGSSPAASQRAAISAPLAPSSKVGAGVWAMRTNRSGKDDSGPSSARVAALRFTSLASSVQPVLEAGDALPQRVERCLRAVVEPELGEDLGESVADRLLAHAERGRYLLVGSALRQMTQDVFLALRQLAQLVVGVAGQLAVRLDLFEDLGRDLGVEQRLACRDPLDGSDEVVGVGVLQQVAARACFDGLEHVAVLAVHREDDDVGVWLLGQYRLGGRHAVELGHLDVHEDHVRPGLQRMPYRFAAVGRLADHAEAFLGLQ